MGTKHHVSEVEVLERLGNQLVRVLRQNLPGLEKGGEILHLPPEAEGIEVDACYVIVCRIDIPWCRCLIPGNIRLIKVRKNLIFINHNTLGTNSTKVFIN